MLYTCFYGLLFSFNLPSSFILTALYFECILFIVKYLGLVYFLLKLSFSVFSVTVCN